MSWRKVTTILKDVLLSAAAKSNFVKQAVMLYISMIILFKYLPMFSSKLKPLTDQDPDFSETNLSSLAPNCRL
jgi:hypothetical protein